jgi:hypothetical protein
MKEMGNSNAADLFEGRWEFIDANGKVAGCETHASIVWQVMWLAPRGCNNARPLRFRGELSHNVIAGDAIGTRNECYQFIVGWHR